MKEKNLKMVKLVVLLSMISILLVGFTWGSLAFATEKETIEFWTISGKGAKLYNWEVKVAQDFEKVYPNIGVKLEFCGDEGLLAKLRGAFAIGNPPDVFYQVGPKIYNSAEAGYIYDLTKAFETKGYEQDGKWKDTFTPSVFNMLKETYGALYWMPVTLRTNGFWYNVDIFRKYGLTIPEYWSEFQDICETLKANKVTPLFSDGTYYSQNFWYFFYLSQRQLGVDYVWRTANNDDPEKYSWKNPAYLKAARMEHNILKYFQEAYQGYTWPTAQVEFSQGKMAMGLMPTWLYEELRTVRPEGLHLGMFRFPMIKGGKGDPTLAEVWTNGWAISQDSRHKEAAIKFLKYASNPKAAEDLVRLIGVAVPVRGIAWSKELEDARRMLENANRTTARAAGLFAFLSDWLKRVLYPPHDDLFLGNLTAEEFITKLDAAHKRYYEGKAK